MGEKKLGRITYYDSLTIINVTFEINQRVPLVYFSHTYSQAHFNKVPRPVCQSGHDQGDAWQSQTPYDITGL